MLEINFDHSSTLFTEVKSLNPTHDSPIRLVSYQLALRIPVLTCQGCNYRWVALSTAFVWALEIQTLIPVLT